MTTNTSASLIARGIEPQHSCSVQGPKNNLPSRALTDRKFLEGAHSRGLPCPLLNPQEEEEAPIVGSLFARSRSEPGWVGYGAKR